MTRRPALALLLALWPVAAAAQQARVAEVQIAPRYLRMVVDAQAQIVATAYDNDGVPVDAAFLWSSGNINVAAVDSDGTVHAVAPGSTVISAVTGSGGARRYGQITVFIRRPRSSMVMVVPSVPDKNGHPMLPPTPPGVSVPPGMPGGPNMDSMIRASVDCHEPYIAAANPMRACYDRRPMMRDHVSLSASDAQCPHNRGAVAMLLFVSETGDVTEVRQYAPSGCESLDSVAEQRARAVRFDPAQKDGRPVGAWVRLMMRLE